LITVKRLSNIFKFFDLKLDPDETKDKMILLCFCDINQQVSQRFVLKLAERARDLAEKDVFVVLVNASATEKDRIKTWAKKHTITFPFGRFNKELIKEIRQAWGIKTLPRLVLAERSIKTDFSTPRCCAFRPRAGLSVLRSSQ